MRFAIANPALSTTLIGIANLEQFEAAANAAQKGPLSAAALARLASCNARSSARRADGARVGGSAMRCEVVAIGTELLLGIIVDGNSAWIGEQLALAGIDSHFQVKVGDNFGRIEACIRQALERSDAVICCGGLGPTQDDITRDVIAQRHGRGDAPRPAIADKIRNIFESRGRVMSANNLRQADIPGGRQPRSRRCRAPRRASSARSATRSSTPCPGVPSEMREMVAGTILPDLRRRMGQTAVIRSRVLRTWGASESGVAEMVAEPRRASSTSSATPPSPSRPAASTASRCASSPSATTRRPPSACSTARRR